jgi:hypothetical protein
MELLALHHGQLEASYHGQDVWDIFDRPFVPRNLL